MMPEKSRVTIVNRSGSGFFAFKHPHTIRFVSTEILFFDIVDDLDYLFADMPLSDSAEIYPDHCQKTEFSRAFSNKIKTDLNFIAF